ncbi:MAG: DUF4145 domain-containing protein [Candidatus Riflebacteria bacterium]
MKREELISEFTQCDIPQWICPKCEVSVLHAGKDDFKSFETEESKRNHSHDEFEPDWIVEHFLATLNCTNPKCKEKVLVTGQGRVRHSYVEDPYGNLSEEFITHFKPRFFFPSLKIFKVAETTPDEIKEILFASFELFFCNPPAAANLARVALEKVIDFLGIRTFKSRTGRRIRVSLHERINLLPAKLSKERDLFMAIKWLGNAGSHENEISQADLIDLYEIFEKLLSEVYEKKDAKISKLAKEVNKRKGPTKR